MRFVSTRAAVALALAFGAVSLSSYAARPEADAAVENAGVIKPVWTPPGISLKPATVIVQLAGDSVAERQGNAGRRLSRAEKDAIKGQLRSQQDAVRGAIQGLGGTVLATYQSAYNGIKVRISRNQVTSLAALPGVVGVRAVQLHKPENVRGVPLIGGQMVWQNLGLHGEGVKVAIIDTGIDYTHATFGGPGTAAAYVTAHAAETAAADPALFGPSAPRVKGGIDLVGDNYDAAADALDENGNPNPKLVPHPDPNPLDCNGHGSHVAGTAAGSGVTSAGVTYTDAYNASTYSTSFNVGPGVAPKADLYSIRVFGCEGSTDVTVEAIDWAVDHDMDVINMSLGAPFGTADDPSAQASTNAAKAGIIVVASAGNSGANAYITGSPASAEGAISVAAVDPTPMFQGALIGTTQAINANGAALPGGALPVKVLRNASGGISLGCDLAEYTAAGVAGKIVVTQRGTCARVARAVFGQQAGAAAVVMVNTDSTFPPFEGTITGNPDTGEQYLVTIPFLGVRSTSASAMNAADGAERTLTANLLTNPGYRAIASFSSGGPRTGDSALKPDVSAPGVSIVSTAVGSGNGAATLSGTSMAAPHTTGVAALTRQAHPAWRAEDIKSAIVHTGSPSEVVGYRAVRGGTGLVQPVGSTSTQVTARTSGGKFGGGLNFGLVEMRNDFSKTLDITLRNQGTSTANFNVEQVNAAGRAHTVALSASSVSVPANGEAVVSVTLNVAAATAGSASAYREVAGLVRFTPQGSDNAGVALRIPYYLVARPQANVSTTLGAFSAGTATATATNKNAAVAGSADFYAWGLSAAQTGGQTNQTADVRAVGVQSFALDAARQLIVFAVNTYNRWSSASSNEFDIYVDTNGDGNPDYVVIGVDFGAVTTGSFDGRMGAFVLDLATGVINVDFLATAPSDGSTAELPVLASRLGLSAAHPRFSYQAVSFDLLNGGAKAVPGVAKYNAWSSSISQGDFLVLPPGGSATSTVSVNAAEAAQTAALGIMVVTTDNKSGAGEAQLIPVR